MIWALILVACIIAVPFLIEAARKPMDDTARASAPGLFVDLSQGVTHYQWTGPVSGPVIVCIHGLTTPSFVWQSVAKGLAATGFRLLTYDLYGRGYSDRPSGVQDPAFFLKQLDDLLESQGIDSEISVIGYSMGGAIAAAFSASQPKRVRRLVLLAPAGMRAVGSPVFRLMATVPVVGYWIMLVLYPSILRKGLSAEADLPTSVPNINVMQNAELRYRGFIPAVHASLRGMLAFPFQKHHKTLQRANVPVLAIWGAQDDVIPLAAKDILAGWNQEARHHVIADAGHGVTYTHTPQVLSHIKKFLAPEA